MACYRNIPYGKGAWPGQPRLLGCSAAFFLGSPGEGEPAGVGARPDAHQFKAERPMMKYICQDGGISAWADCHFPSSPFRSRGHYDNAGGHR
jgi:hypothetical protein